MGEVGWDLNLNLQFGVLFGCPLSEGSFAVRC